MTQKQNPGYKINKLRNNYYQNWTEFKLYKKRSVMLILLEVSNEYYEERNKNSVYGQVMVFFYHN